MKEKCQECGGEHGAFTQEVLQRFLDLMRAPAQDKADRMRDLAFQFAEEADPTDFRHCSEQLHSLLEEFEVAQTRADAAAMRLGRAVAETVWEITDKDELRIVENSEPAN